MIKNESTALTPKNYEKYDKAFFASFFVHEAYELDFLFSKARSG